MGAEAQRLRQAVLQAALEGKLVAQDPNDEPASVLLERIAAEKERLVKEKKLKNEKALSPVTSQEPSFEIPKNWSWARIGDVVQLVNGRAYKKSEMLAAGKYPLLRVGNLFTNEQWYYSDLALPDEKYCHTGDLLYSWSASFGPFIWEGPECIFHYHIWNVRSFGILRDYLYWFFEADKATILRSTTGIAMYHVSMENMRPRLIPVPPLEEQHRIVAKIAELMPLIDEFEKLEDELNDLEAELPEKLKQAVLQAAIEGKLVAQDPNDEPASVLLGQIAVEKDRLAAEKRIKKQKALTPIKNEERPFEIPENWTWCRLGDLAVKITDGTHHSPPNSRTGDYMYVTAKNIKEPGVSLKDVTYVSQKVHDEIFERCDPSYGDILLIKDGATTGVVTINNVMEPFSMLSSVALIKTVMVDNAYLMYVLRSSFFYESFRRQMKGTGIPRITLKQIVPFLVPVPPLNEQHRIVAKLEELMPLIDEFEKLEDELKRA